MTQFASSTKNPSVKFVVKNTSSIKRTIKVFNQGIGFGNTYDLLNIPGIGEQEIIDSLLKGDLKAKISSGALTVIESTIVISSAGPEYLSFLKSLGLGSSLSPKDGNGAYLSQAVWFIDSVNGNDANDGLTSSTALKTFAEFSARLGKGNVLLPPIQLYLGFLPFRLCTVTLMNDLPTNDPITLDVTLGTDVLVNIVAAPKTPVATGSMQSVIAKNRTTNTPYTLTDNTINWPSNLYKRLRITSGPRAGAFAYAVEAFDGYCITSDWSVPNPSGLPGVTPVVPQVGDQYAVDNLVTCIMGKMDLNATGNNVGTYQFTPISFTNLQFKHVTSTAFNIALPRFANSLMFNGCTFECFPLIDGGFNFYDNCCFRIGCGFFDGGAVMNGGVAVDEDPARASFTASHALTILGTAFAILDADVMCYGGPIFHIGPGAVKIFDGYIGCFKAQNAVGVAGVSRPGNGMILFSGSSAIQQNVNLGGNGFWGSGNVAHGLHVQAQAYYSYTNTLPTVTGTMGDFSLGKETQTQSYAFNPATQAYTTARDNTWTNLSTAIGSGGFGGNAIDPRTGAAILDFTDGF